MVAARSPRQDMRDHALAYAQQGIPVFALIPRQKEPATGNGFYAATTDARKIRAMFGPYSNIGMPTGTASGVFIIDIDPRHGGTLDSLRALGDLPETRTVRSGGGGYQLYFPMPDGVDIRNHVNILPGIDVRGTRGYVVLPPSVHPSGNRYELLCDMEPAAAPEWLIRLVMTPERPTSGYTAPVDVPEDQDAEARYWLERYLRDACDGTRNNTGFRLATQLRDTARLTEMEAEPYMLEYAARVPDVPGDPYTDRHALKSLRSAYKQPARDPARSRLAIVPEPEAPADPVSVPENADIVQLRQALAKANARIQELERELKWIDRTIAVSNKTLSPSQKLVAIAFRKRVNQARREGRPTLEMRVWRDDLAKDIGSSPDTVSGALATMSENTGFIEYRADLKVNKRPDNATDKDKKKVVCTTDTYAAPGKTFDMPEKIVAIKARNWGGNRVRCPAKGVDGNVCGSENILIQRKTFYTCKDCGNHWEDAGPITEQKSEDASDLPEGNLPPLYSAGDGNLTSGNTSESEPPTSEPPDGKLPSGEQEPPIQIAGPCRERPCMETGCTAPQIWLVDERRMAPHTHVYTQEGTA